MSAEPVSLREVLAGAERWLAGRGVPGPRADAQALLAHVLGLSKMQLYLQLDRPLTEEERASAREALRRRGEREPLAWITGSTGFHAIDLHTPADVLVPRPDTETLVERALAWIDHAHGSAPPPRPVRPRERIAEEDEVVAPELADATWGDDDDAPAQASPPPRRPEGAMASPADAPAPEAASGPDADPIYVADVGAGTGAVGLALAAARPGVRVYATDVSEAALSATRANVEALGLGQRVAVLKGPLLTPIPPRRPVDWVVSNPPYIPTAHLAGLEPEVSRWEPRLALDGGADGLDVYRALIPAARARARRGLLVEIGHDQAEAVAGLFRAAGFTDVTVWQDLGRRDRVVGGRIP